ncbi:3-oxoacyl-ACP synthase [Winogradskyella alexanderae]|uniref:3-oxoacyl-ACP synthase n=1 Tax=Winogradskyella alexanderae TaxID=2877123 RepID=A0ABS7XP33_9FLAO|nr:3-oxoacyl-ACP synthase [Winogradskyella alexanderae]MCA0131228.1 3-oxoacyl-ACP synthase [Winogradskyella alexanderae]
MNLKQKLYNCTQDILNDRLKVIQTTISGIQNALLSETKNTAGDKHETGRAMLQLEREKAGQQLAEIQKQFEILNKINPRQVHSKVALGSIVFTTLSNYFISTSVGEIQLKNQNFFAISMASPIATLIAGKTTDQSFLFRNEEITITKIL